MHIHGHSNINTLMSSQEIASRRANEMELKRAEEARRKTAATLLAVGRLGEGSGQDAPSERQRDGQSGQAPEEVEAKKGFSAKA
ncbi:MAG TPA: hypothetical protein VNW54_05040 [Granulicella sp.]|jgi:hypothetical protein|nr:hypothetical protein [Granulicella sp.]